MKSAQQLVARLLEGGADTDIAAKNELLQLLPDRFDFKVDRDYGNGVNGVTILFNDIDVGSLGTTDSQLQLSALIGDAPRWCKKLSELHAVSPFDPSEMYHGVWHWYYREKHLLKA